MKKASVVVGISTDSKQPTITVNQDLVPIDLLLELARQYNIPVVRNPELARQLSSFDIDDELPYELLVAIEESLKLLEKDAETKNKPNPK
jgi:type III secretion system FlhB-like substrate exporter